MDPDQDAPGAGERLRVCRSLDFTRSRPGLFLPDDEPPAFAIASLLLETALRQGVAPLTVRASAEFRAIGADRDWLWRERDGERYVFDRLIALPGVSNSFRGEILLSAFAPFWAAVANGRVAYRSSARFDDARVLREAQGLGAFAVVVFAGSGPCASVEEKSEWCGESR